MPWLSVVREIFILVGSALAFILAGLQIWAFWRKRVILDIKIIKAGFTDLTQGRELLVTVDADINNRGLESTSIASVELQFDMKEIDDVMLNNHECIFRQIKISGNDIRTETLYASIFLKGDIKKKTIDGKLIFKTPHKEIKKAVTLERQD